MSITPMQLEARSRADLYPANGEQPGKLDSNSLSAYREGGAHETNFNPLTAPDFLNVGQEDEAVEWVLDEYLPAGGLVILAGKPKEGKTTVAYQLAVKVAKGGLPFLNRETYAGGVLILGLEEHSRDMRLRLRSLGADDLANLHVHANQLDPSPDTFQAIKEYALKHAISLIVIDTLGAFWSVRDENDAAGVTKAIKPFLALARDTGACVLLIHHARKSEGSYGDEIRGSGALFAAVDVALILKRCEVKTQRRLYAISRYPETPSEVILELTESGYIALGDPTAVNRQAKREKVKAALSEELQDAKTVAKIAGVPFRDVYRLLNDLAKSEAAHQEGSGRRGDPYLYRRFSIRATPPDIGGAQHEMNLRRRAFDSCNPPSPCTKENPACETEEEINLVD